MGSDCLTCDTLSNSTTLGVVGSDMARFSISTVIHALAEDVWEALADIGSIHVWNPGVTSSHATTEKASGLGASRHCDLGGGNYLEEEVVHFDQGERLTMRVTASNLPFARADIRFLVESEGSSTRVTVEPEYELKFGPIGAVMDRLLVRRRYEQGMHALLEGLKRHVESEVRAG